MRVRVCVGAWVRAGLCVFVCVLMRSATCTGDRGARMLREFLEEHQVWLALTYKLLQWQSELPEQVFLLASKSLLLSCFGSSACV